MRKCVPLKEFIIKIKSQKWAIKLFSDRDFEYIAPGDLAYTIYNHKLKNPVREIHFSEKARVKSTVAHELMHAFLSYRPLSERMSIGLVEEIVCDTYGNNKTYMDLLVKKILKELIKK